MNNNKIHDLQDGKIFHDGIGRIVLNQREKASFNTNADAGDLGNDEYHERAVYSSASDGDDSSRSKKDNATFRKRFQENRIIVTGFARRSAVSGSGSVVTTHETKIIAKASDQSGNDAEGSVDINSSSATQFSFSFDISNLVEGDLVTIQVDCLASVTVSNADGGTYTSDVWLREDVIAETES